MTPLCFEAGRLYLKAFGVLLMKHSFHQVLGAMASFHQLREEWTPQKLASRKHQSWSAVVCSQNNDPQARLRSRLEARFSQTV
jgi:hypothetical protein